MALGNSPRTPFHGSLYFRVLVAIALGIVVGAVAPEFAEKLEPLGTGFIRLVKMTIAPLIFCTVVAGISGMKNMKEVGKAGGLAMLYFEVVTTLALAIGLVIVTVVRPGGGIDARPTAKDLQRVQEFLGKKPKSNFFLDIIPDFGSNLLPVLFAAIVFGFALHASGERGKPVRDVIDSFGEVMFKLVGMIMKLAPIGAFGAMAFTIAKYGLGSLQSLGLLMACFYATCLVFVFGVLGLIARLHGFSIFRFVRYIREELFIVLGTSSSESVLPRMIGKLEDAGAGKPIAGLVVPAGYSFNLDGTAIYVTMGALFVAQATNTSLDLWQQLELLGIAMLTSKGAAGVTGSGFVCLAATIEAFDTVPVAGLVLILGIDRFMSEARALTNVTGNGVATLVVARWCKDLDREKLHAALHPPPAEP
jgi:aerobic C4-dicarboxylate transport protein